MDVCESLQSQDPSCQTVSIKHKSPISNNGTIDLSVRRQISELFGVKMYRRLLFLIALYILPTSMLSVFLVPFGAAWFGGCDVNANDINTCKFDYDRWVFWDSLSLTVMGFVSFLFSGFLGRASDSFGRKIFLLLTLICALINRGIMVFTDNLWIFFILRILTGINGGRGQTPVMNAYYADILPSHLKTLGFGLSYGVVGIMLFVGAIVATTISILHSAHFNWTAIAIVYIIAILYCILFVKESLSPLHRQQFSCKNFNPIRPLLHVADNKIVLWIAVIQFIISLPLSGIVPIILVYLSDSLDIHDNSESAVINAIFLVSMGVSGIICTGIVLPILKRNFKDLFIAEIGISLSILSQLIFASFYYIPKIWVIVAGGLLYFSVGISNAALFGILTKSLSAKEQGQGFGIVQSYRAITTVIAPFTFAAGYRNSKRIGVPSLPFFVAAVIIASALILTRCALKQQMKMYSMERRHSTTIDSRAEYEDEYNYGSYQESKYNEMLMTPKDVSMVGGSANCTYSFNKSNQSMKV